MTDLLKSQWRISGGFEIAHHTFGEQCVLYHRGSGDTHLIDSVVFCIVDELNHGERSFEQLMARLADDFEFESPNQMLDYMGTLISELQKLAIIERLDE